MRRDDLAYMLVQVVDARGRVVPDAVHVVEFAVFGAGELAAVGNVTTLGVLGST